ncbi:MAG: shikimate dehydrogenase [bacterium]|nr:shikimate dehydrogenase [Deltaproteobacteria bacterium]MCP4905458.1 shikimate dehydrogenase [bacterium]
MNAETAAASARTTARASLECGVVLHPAGHTRSPAMHNAAYRALGLDAHYEAFDIPPEELARAVAGFRKRGLRQWAVSIPHKESMMDLVDEVEPVGRAIGAINTVTRVDERLVGTNTDWIGAIRALERVAPVAGQRAVVLGAGGTARALVYALRNRGCEVFVLNRTQERAERLVDELGAISAGALDDLPSLDPEIVVNTTSVGLSEMRSPVPKGALREGMIVLDVVYAPERTQLLIDCEARGGRAVGGKWMLVYQAVEQLRLWTALLGTPPSNDAILTATETMARAFDQAGQH